jgi:hypothetical protein
VNDAKVKMKKAKVKRQKAEVRKPVPAPYPALAEGTYYFEK